MYKVKLCWPVCHSLFGSLTLWTSDNVSLHFQEVSEAVSDLSLPPFLAGIPSALHETTQPSVSAACKQKHSSRAGIWSVPALAFIVWEHCLGHSYLFVHPRGICRNHTVCTVGSLKSRTSGFCFLSYCLTGSCTSAICCQARKKPQCWVPDSYGTSASLVTHAHGNTPADTDSITDGILKSYRIIPQVVDTAHTPTFTTPLLWRRNHAKGNSALISQNS